MEKLIWVTLVIFVIGSIIFYLNDQRNIARFNACLNSCGYSNGTNANVIVCEDTCSQYYGITIPTQ